MSGNMIYWDNATEAGNTGLFLDMLRFELVL